MYTVYICYIQRAEALKSCILAAPMILGHFIVSRKEPLCYIMHTAADNPLLLLLLLLSLVPAGCSFVVDVDAEAIGLHISPD